MTNHALNEKYARLDRLQLAALAGLMFIGTAFVFSATMVSPAETERIWFAQTWLVSGEECGSCNAGWLKDEWGGTK